MESGPRGHKPPVPVRILIVLVALTAVVLLARQVASRGRSPLDGPVQASGIVEARTIEVASEIAGTVVSRPVEKGQTVFPGQVLAIVASDVNDAELERARAALQTARDQALRADESVRLQAAVSSSEVTKAYAGAGTARARLADVKAGARPQELETARAAVRQAGAARDAARTRLSELQAGLRPEEVEQAQAALSAASAEVASARSRLADLEAGARPQEVQEAKAAVARVEATAAKAQKDYDRARTLVAQGALSASQLDTHLAAYETSQAELRAARERLALVQAGTRPDQVAAARGQLDKALAQQESARQALALARQGPRSEQVKAAAAALRQAEAALDAADANQRLLASGARPGQIATAASQSREAQAALALARANLGQTAVREAEARAAHAQVAQAEAALAAAAASLRKFTIRASVPGHVDDTHVRAGEVVRQGSSILTLVDFSDTWLTVYVPEPQLARLKLGDSAEVTVDGRPGQPLHGAVRRIADQAEFTPKFVQTHEERARTVFAVEIAISNTGGLLKPGMPADAVIGVAALPAAGIR